MVLFLNHSFGFEESMVNILLSSAYINVTCSEQVYAERTGVDSLNLFTVHIHAHTQMDRQPKNTMPLAPSAE